MKQILREIIKQWWGRKTSSVYFGVDLLNQSHPPGVQRGGVCKGGIGSKI